MTITTTPDEPTAATVTGQALDLVGAEFPCYFVATYIGREDGIAIGADDTLRFGPVKSSVGTTMVADFDVPGLYDFTVYSQDRAADGRQVVKHIGPYAVSGDVSLKAILQAQPIGPLPDPTDAQVIDELVAANLGDAGSSTSQAVNDRVVTSIGSNVVTQGRYGLLLDVLTGDNPAAGDGTTDDTAAIQARLTTASVYGGTVLLGKHRINSSITVPAGVRLQGRNGEAALIAPNGFSTAMLILDANVGGSIENLKFSCNGTANALSTAVSIRGNASDVRLTNLRATALGDGFRVEGGVGSTPGIVKRVLLENCYAENSVVYGYRFDDVNAVDMIACRSKVSGLDAVKLRKNVTDLTVNGGSFEGAIGGDGLDAYAGGTRFTLTGGASFSNNQLNGIVIKTDDLNATDPAGYGYVRNSLINGVMACNNGGSGVTIHRNSGDTDDTTEPLVQSITISGLQAHDNTNYGLFINARQVTATGVHAKGNGLDGIKVHTGALDVDIVAPHVAGNSRATPNARDGISIAGKRVKVWGGSSNGTDFDGATGDTDLDALAAGPVGKTQRYGIFIATSAANCTFGLVSLRNNRTGTYNDSGADTVIINNPTDTASAPFLVMPNNQRLFGKNATGTPLSLAYVTTGGGANYGDAATSTNILGTVINLFAKAATPASTTTRASLNVPAGVAPTTPVNGDVWSDGTNLFVRLGGVTRTITLT